MALAAIDWAILGAYFVLSGAIGLRYASRAGKDPAQFFVSGRSLPWWLAGTSMVATTFAADTPLAVTGMVASYGVAGNWLWWSMVMSNVLTVFFFARLWRRAEVITDAELSELRYSGRPAAALRVFRALYLALPVNLIVIGWVNLAMVKILGVALGVAPVTAMVVMAAVTFVYSAVSGLWGVVVTDFVQFGIAMAGSIVLAVFSVDAVGGLDALVGKLSAHYGSAEAALAFLPGAGASWMPVTAFLVYLTVQWWASSYPGSEPGGGGYVAQRIFSARSERDGMLATLWFTVAHYAVRPWPWIVTALAVVVLYPGMADPASGYVRAVVDLLPAGVRGLLLAAFAAAYMSTISTQLNWGASYLVNDVYLRFARGEGARRRAIWVSRASTAGLFLLSLAVTAVLAKAGSIEGAWRVLIAIGAGTGPVLILRWFWWRISAWSEIAAMAASLASFVALTATGALDPTDPLQGAYLMVAATAISTVAWVAVTLLAPATELEVLGKFYARVRPGGWGWRPVREELGLADEPLSAPRLPLLTWLAGVASVYGSLFGTGALLFRTAGEAVAWFALAAGSFAFVAWSVRER